LPLAMMILCLTLAMRLALWSHSFPSISSLQEPFWAHESQLLFFAVMSVIPLGCSVVVGISLIYADLHHNGHS
jgi:hypothetical protein